MPSLSNVQKSRARSVILGRNEATRYDSMFHGGSASGFESGTISQALRTGRVTVYTVQTSGQRWKPHEAKKIERKN